VRLVIVTPEEAPLAVFGPRASAALAKLLAGRRIEIELDAHVQGWDGEEFVVAPGARRIKADEAMLSGGRRRLLCAHRRVSLRARVLRDDQDRLMR
jgi:hypothetical protein